MAYQNYSQTDPRWTNQRLGTVNDWTLGLYGCFVTAMSNVAEHFGYDLTPAELDDIFTDRGLYVDGGLCVDDMLSKVKPDIKFAGVYHCEDAPCDLSVFNEFNNYEHEAIVELDASAAPGIQTHFNRFYDYDADTGVVRIVDSEDGEIVAINRRYGNPADVILKVVKYVGPSQFSAPAEVMSPIVAPEPTPEAPAIAPEPVEQSALVLPPVDSIQPPSLPTPTTSLPQEPELTQTQNVLPQTSNTPQVITSHDNKGLWKFLEGKRTHIIAVLFALYNVWHSGGHFTPETIDALIAAAGLSALRAGVENSKK